MYFASRTYRIIHDVNTKSISIETVDNDMVRITVGKSGNGTTNEVSIDLSKKVARCIRDNLNTYLDETDGR